MPCEGKNWKIHVSHPRSLMNPCYHLLNAAGARRCLQYRLHMQYICQIRARRNIAPTWSIKSDNCIQRGAEFVAHCC